MRTTTYSPISNPVTGDRCLILQTSADELRLRFWIAPRSTGAPLHFHRSLTESFQVVEGVMTLELDGKGHFSELRAGSGVRIPPGRLHSFSNRHSERLVFEAHLQPPARFLNFVLGLYGLASAGKVNRQGMPRNPIALLRLLAFGDVWLPGLPLVLQRGIFNAAGRLSRWMALEEQLLGYGSALLHAARADAGVEARA